ncbi:glycoside hydrolase family 88 protein [Roseateles sp.]|uniref:glycoside hydrolase family 88 protein n=1 Tax=Roseateles sp. TaxID=1971397 RepID=UPI003BA7DD3D
MSPSLYSTGSLQDRVRRALDTAVEQLFANRENFRDVFPGDNTIGNVYRPHVQEGFADGSNVGWTTGLWTGQLWMAYELSSGEGFRDVAEDHVKSFARRLELREDLATHDLGFLYTPSCVAAYRLTGSQLAKDSALQAADELMSRYLPAAGVIQAWGDLNDPAQRGRMIIDCLMNLPLLRWAGEVRQDPKYKAAADAHCAKARDYLVRPDASTFHTYHFDPATGEPERGSTHQGASDSSCWARGQAWGIYGFALNHKHAPELNLLDTAIRVADYFLEHLPKNGVAYWDLSFGEGSGESWDSSASAIAVCGLLELSEQLPPGAQSSRYRAEALGILDGLMANCVGDLSFTKALLLHGVYHKPHGRGVDEANLWGDYFYLEALARVDRIHWTPHW